MTETASEEALVCRGTGIVYELEPEVRPVSSGETLKAIAEAAELTPIELLAFNCGSLSPEILGRYLRTVFGCTQLGPEASLGAGVLAVPRPLELVDGESRQLELRFWKAWYHLRMDLATPGALQHQDDTFTLKSSDGAYTCTQSVQDDVDQRNAWLDLDFYGLVPDKSYTLEVAPGNEGEPYRLFEEVAFADLFAPPSDAADVEGAAA